MGLYIICWRFEGGCLRNLAAFAAQPAAAEITTAELELLLEGASFTVHERARAWRGPRVSGGPCAFAGICFPAIFCRSRFACATHSDEQYWYRRSHRRNRRYLSRIWGGAPTVDQVHLAAMIPPNWASSAPRAIHGSTGASCFVRGHLRGLGRLTPGLWSFRGATAFPSTHPRVATSRNHPRSPAFEQIGPLRFWKAIFHSILASTKMSFVSSATNSSISRRLRRRVDFMHRRVLGCTPVSYYSMHIQCMTIHVLSQVNRGTFNINVKSVNFPPFGASGYLEVNMDTALRLLPIIAGVGLFFRLLALFRAVRNDRVEKRLHDGSSTTQPGTPRPSSRPDYAQQRDQLLLSGWREEGVGFFYSPPLRRGDSERSVVSAS